MKCPICGRESNNWVYCPEQKMTICDKHCRDCLYFSGYETSVTRCYFREREIKFVPNAKSK